jgi:hypothetical protein
VPALAAARCISSRPCHERLTRISTPVPIRNVPEEDTDDQIYCLTIDGDIALMVTIDPLPSGKVGALILPVPYHDPEASDGKLVRPLTARAVENEDAAMDWFEEVKATRPWDTRH